MEEKTGGLRMERIGIIGAMEQEVDQLKAQMQVTKVEQKASMEFVSGNLAGKQVVVVRSGIGKVNAAICTQILADIYQVDGIVNTGIAGALHQELNIGDIVVSTDALQHDMDATGFGYKMGVIPQMELSIFPADEKLAKVAQEACRKVNPEIQVFAGRVVSGDQFISNHEKKKWLTENFGGYCTEMEGAAIAQAAWLNGIPFLIIRAISDKADESAKMDYGEFEKKAIEHTVKLVMEMVQKL